jgi:hypothetical protein
VSFHKGDLVGFRFSERVEAFVITKVVREQRFYFAYSVISNKHRLIVHDPENCFLIYPGYDPQIEPDESMRSISTEMYDALDKLFSMAGDFEDGDLPTKK